MTKNKSKTLVFSCSGCSSSAQMANWLAIKLDREGHAEMSCIAGIGGHVPSLVRKAKNAQMIIGIDGCPLECVQNCLKQHGLTSNVHIELSSRNIKKSYHQDFDLEDAQRIYEEFTLQLAENSQTITSYDNSQD